MGISIERDARARPRPCPATRQGARRPTRGRRYPADPPRVEEIVAVMRQAGESSYGSRLRGMIVVLWRAGLRIHEALALAETDLEERRGAILVRHGKGDKRREVGMDDWGWEQLRPWLSCRATMPVGTLFCGIGGPSVGRGWTASAVRSQLRRLAAEAGVRRRFAPHQLRHAHAIEMAGEGVPLNIIQRQLGHTDLGVTSTYLPGIDNAEIINAVHARRAPMMPASAGLRL
ncbi:MAG: site-specific integrase [Actinomycetota bacterium]|nr:site-specific integrase [Actinomycetota bacterium]